MHVDGGPILSGMILLRLDWMVPQKTECSCVHTYAEKLRFTKHLRNPREGMADGFTLSAPFAVVQWCKLEASIPTCIIALEQTRSGAITGVGGSVSAVVVLGSRQVGKTTLARMVVPNASYQDIESPLMNLRFRHDPAHELGLLGGMSVLDEDQTAPPLFSALRGESQGRPRCPPSGIATSDEWSRSYARISLTTSP
jgi:hypothetical protein